MPSGLWHFRQSIHIAFNVALFTVLEYKSLSKNSDLPLKIFHLLSLCHFAKLKFITQRKLTAYTETVLIWTLWMHNTKAHNSGYLSLTKGLSFCFVFLTYGELFGEGVVDITEMCTFGKHSKLLNWIILMTVWLGFCLLSA